MENEFGLIGKIAKEKAKELKELGKSLPLYIRTLEGYGDFMIYTAEELERFKANYGTEFHANFGQGFDPGDFVVSTGWKVPSPTEVETSITTLSGIGTNVTCSIASEMQKTARSNDSYFSILPPSFVQLRNTDELLPLLDQLDLKLSPIWKSSWDSLALERDDSLKTASINARSVVDEISRIPIYDHLRALPWCQLDEKGDPIRAVRYAWIKYGETLPPELKNDPSADLLWKNMGHAYTVLNKYVHTIGYDKTALTQVEVPLRAMELGLITYLREGMARLIAARDSKKQQ